ncbi:MAG: hypothetical protein J7L47_03145 [Candidatus Odinarchaeota archaeon]|nr:hypothetical protein [Candidatus Odinarchaeota archaeon]
MRAFKQIFIDNRHPRDEFAWDYLDKVKIDKLIPQILGHFVRDGYNPQKIKLQQHQAVFLLLKTIENREFTLELKYGSREEFENRFIQISTEMDNPELKIIETFIESILKGEDGDGESEDEGN